MKKQIIYLFLICVASVRCGNNNTVDKDAIINDTDWVTVTPKNYLDFNYSKVIAFATVDPFDYSELWGENINLSKFHDTISKTLDSTQVVFLNDLLSGRHRKPYTKETGKDIADCFYPRHNIIFLDQQDSAINYISVCFECGNRKQSKAALADMENYETFFNSIGLKVFDRPDYYKQYYDSLNKLKSVIHPPTYTKPNKTDE